jgi:hypothetical protein
VAFGSGNNKEDQIGTESVHSGMRADSYLPNAWTNGKIHPESFGELRTGPAEGEFFRRGTGLGRLDLKREYGF